MDIRNNFTSRGASYQEFSIFYFFSEYINHWERSLENGMENYSSLKIVYES